MRSRTYASMAAKRFAGAGGFASAGALWTGSAAPSTAWPAPSDAPALAEVDTESARRLREDIARVVHNGKECGEVDEHLDPQSAAVRLAAVREGLALQVYREPEGAAGQAVTRFDVPLLEAEIAVVFTGECRQYTE
ncbi:TetR family transcriptional regulator C-terminal domain-containing protein [Streptomyces sp. R44]|uniref:TetR family transcriptional regulator C-terminal domain-containing protein n=1 Tax=Streptomyces sp. R44 TaxID=3238633 RepID=A0AB39SU09_9ACTN